MAPNLLDPRANSIQWVLIIKPPLELVSPHAGLQESYLRYIAELTERDEPAIPFCLGFDPTNFPALLDRLESASRGVGVPAGLAANSTYWLVWNGTEVVGVSNLRHSLTPKLRRSGGNIGYGIRPSARGQGFGTKILAHTLGKAAGFGLKQALLTCAKSNTPSVRVIVGNGGVFDSEEFLPELGEILQRYWVPVPPSSQ